MRNIKRIKPSLIIYDLIAATISFLIVICSGMFTTNNPVELSGSFFHCVIYLILVILCRYILRIYNQIWRYGGVQCYLKLMISDTLVFALYCLTEIVFYKGNLSVICIFSIVSLNLILSLGMRFAYRYCYKYANQSSRKGRLFWALLSIFSLGSVVAHSSPDVNKIPVAILGAGNLGVSLADELNASASSKYSPRIFIDANKSLTGKEIGGLSVYNEEEITKDLLNRHEIQEAILAIPNLSSESRRELFYKYDGFGVKVKVYDANDIRSEGGKPVVKDFDIEELLFRKPIVVVDDFTRRYFQGKTIMITGGGGSIGSEMARQVARMHPKKLILLDIAENGVYNLNVELKFAYGTNLNLAIEIADVTDKETLRKVFNEYKPQIVIHCAAHKHVPLMEHNCVESIRNNVFGTLNAVEVSEEYGVERFVMVSTDKAVNPVNVMGATKRVCEMIVNTHAKSGTKTTFNTTRFGNVLGSAGSVVPIFKKQLAEGGPLTVTDFRIIRYFMTIPEASQLVLKSAAMAKNGELFVLDMGKPVKILSLAENIIKLSGLEPYKDINIIEVGLRPGEKLYEELLIQPDKLDKTSDELIFIEHDAAISPEELSDKLEKLKIAVQDKDNEKAKEVLKSVVPTFRNPEDVNEEAIERDWNRIVLGKTEE